jgi:hypothetical protein
MPDEENARTFASKRFRDGQTDAAAGARDKRDLAGKALHRVTCTISLSPMTTSTA